MQLRHETPLTSKAYLAERAWRKASLAVCPRHPQGGCGFARHGTYPRKTPTGMRVARYYCPTAHETFSLLPDCLASRFPSDLDDLERVATHVARSRSVEAAADGLRPEIALPSAVRWIRRRLTLVRASVSVLAGLVGRDVVEGTLAAFRTTWDRTSPLRSRRPPHRRAYPCVTSTTRTSNMYRKHFGLTGHPFSPENSGSGKTCACRRVLSRLHTGLYRVIYVSLSTGNVMDLYKTISWEAGLAVERSTGRSKRRSPASAPTPASGPCWSSMKPITSAPTSSKTSAS